MAAVNLITHKEIMTLISSMFWNNKDVRNKKAQSFGLSVALISALDALIKKYDLPKEETFDIFRTTFKQELDEFVESGMAELVAKHASGDKEEILDMGTLLNKIEKDIKDHE